MDEILDFVILIGELTWFKILLFRWCHMGGSINGGIPKLAGWLISWKIPLNMDDWGNPYFRKPLYLGRLDIQMPHAPSWFSTLLLGSLAELSVVSRSRAEGCGGITSSTWERSWSCENRGGCLIFTQSVSNLLLCSYTKNVCRFSSDFVLAMEFPPWVFADCTDCTDWCWSRLMV